MKHNQADENEKSATCAKYQKESYEKPTLSYHGEWQALTLSFSIPIAIEGEGSVTYRRP